jgi:SpoVK/Ycf46/Vps4 family AAA+-type ATPase
MSHTFPKTKTSNNNFISPAFSNIVHPSVEFDTAQWIGPFKTVINTKGLRRQTVKHDHDSFDECYDEQSDVLATLTTLVNYGIPSGSIIELGSTNDLKGRASRIDAITAGNLLASILPSPEAIPHLASLDDPTPELPIVPVNAGEFSCDSPLNNTQHMKGSTIFPNLLADEVLYISPQIAAQLAFTPTEYSHLPLDQLVCNHHEHTCGHPTQFKKTQTDFAHHHHDDEFNEDHVITVPIPLEKHIYIRVAQLPRVTASTSSTETTPSIPQSLRSELSPQKLRIAQRGVFYLLPALNNFPPNVVQDILVRYLSTPLKHQINPFSRGRQLHVGTVFAVPITIQEEDRLYHQSLEEKAEDHDEENLSCIPGAYFPVDCLYFYCAQLECDKNTYTATDQNGSRLYEDEEMAANSGHHNNFLTCKLTRVVSPSIQDARALAGLKALTPHENRQQTRQHSYLTTENIDVHRTTSYMLVDGAHTDILVHSFNLTCLRPSLFQHLYSTAVTNQQNYTTLVQLAIKHALVSSPSNPNVQSSLLNLLHKYPTLLFNIPILDTLLLRGYGPAFSSLFVAILPSFYSLHSFILPLLQSTHTKNSKATLLRALSYLIHLDYIEIDTDQAEGLISEGDIQYITSAMSSVINIRNIGTDTVIPPLPPRQTGIVNNLYILTASCADVPKHVLATDVINVPLPAPTPRTRMYIYELLTRMNFNSNGKLSPSNTSSPAFFSHGVQNDISCKQLSAMMICAYVGLTGYTNASTQSVSLLSQAILVRAINSFKTDKELFTTVLQKKQDALLTCHCNVLGQVLQHNNVASGIPNVSWKDIGAAGTIRKELMQLIKPKTGSTSNDALSAAFSLQRRGVLLYGPPGSGKTLVAKALAGESGIGFVTANAGEILSMYIGESEKKIRDLFINARNSAPCVLFLDEIDSLAPSKNNSGNSGGGGVMQRIVSQLLLEIDSLNDDGIDVFLVGATNRPELLDLSLLRPGRLDRSIYVGISNTVDDQLQILKALTRKFLLGPRVNLRKIIEAYCHGRPLTGADFFALASTSMTYAIMDAVNNVEREKSGQIVDVDADDYDVEEDPDPIVPKVSISKQVGDLNTFANSDIINKTLSASNLGGISTPAPDTSLPSVSYSPLDSNQSAFGSLLGESTKPNKKKLNLFNFGKEPEPLPPSNGQSSVTIEPSTILESSAPKKRKKKVTDAILDFGIPLSITPETRTPAIPDGPIVPDQTAIPPLPQDQSIQSPPEQTQKKNKKKRQVGMDLFDIPGMSFSPAPETVVDQIQDVPSITPVVDQTIDLPDTSTNINTDHAHGKDVAESKPKGKKKRNAGMDLFDIPGMSFTPLPQPTPSEEVPVAIELTASTPEQIIETQSTEELAPPESTPEVPIISTETPSIEQIDECVEPEGLDDSTLENLEHDEGSFGESQHDEDENDKDDPSNDGFNISPISIDLVDEEPKLTPIQDVMKNIDPQIQIGKAKLLNQLFGSDDLGLEMSEDAMPHQDDEDEDYDDGDDYIPLPAYAGVQLQLLLGGEEQNTSIAPINTNPDDQFTFQDESDESDIDYLSDNEDEGEMLEMDEYEEYKEEEIDENDDDTFASLLQQQFVLQQELDDIEEQKREQVALSVAMRGVVVCQKHFIQAAKKLTPSLSKEELEHYKKIREQFSSKRQKKMA